MAMIRAYMTNGHLAVDLDHLSLDEVTAECGGAVGDSYALPNAEMRKLVDYRFYGFNEADLDKHYFIDLPNLGGIVSR